MDDQQKKPINQYIRFSGMALQMGVVIAAGTYLGLWLDEKYPNDYSGFTVSCSLLAVIISMYMVIRQVQELSKKK